MRSSSLASSASVLQVVIVYEDLAAGKRAMGITGGLVSDSGVMSEPIPWSFDMLSDMDWGAAARADAVHADILIIASSSVAPFTPAVKRWVEAAVLQKRAPSAIVALFGPEGRPDRAGSPRFRTVETAAQRAGLDFFAPSPLGQFDRSANHVRSLSFN